MNKSKTHNIGFQLATWLKGKGIALKTAKKWGYIALAVLFLILLFTVSFPKLIAAAVLVAIIWYKVDISDGIAGQWKDGPDGYGLYVNGCRVDND